MTRTQTIPAGTTDEANGASTNPSISRDGSTIAFESLASNLAGRLDTNGTSDIYARDRTNHTTTLVSTVSPYSPTAAALGQSYHPSISPDGTNVAWATDAHWPVDTNGVRDIYYLQLRNGAQPLTAGTQRILSWDQAGGAGQSNGTNDYPAASNSTHAFASQAASFGGALGVSLIIDHAFVNQGGSILCAAAAIAVAAVGIAVFEVATPNPGRTYANEMKVELQDSTTSGTTPHTWPVPIRAREPITATQVQQALAELYVTAREGARGWFPWKKGERIMDQVINDKVIPRVKARVPGGICTVGHFITAPFIVSGTEFRIDVSNLAGCNLLTY